MAELFAAMSHFAKSIMENKNYVHEKPDNTRESWPEASERVSRFVMDRYLPELRPKVQQMICNRQFMPGGRYLYSAGRRYSQLQNCMLWRADDSREGWAELLHDTASCLMTGGGVGVDYSPLRPQEYIIKGMGGKSTGPISLARIINEGARYIIQGGSRRSALWAGLLWSHPDIFHFIHCKDQPKDLREYKAQNFNFPVPMEGTNISVILDDDFFAAYHTPGWSKTYSRWGTTYQVDHAWAHRVYWESVRSMLETAEPGLSIDVGPNAGQSLRNACTEATSADNGDVCNLGSLNMARFSSLGEFAAAVRYGTAFLLCGTLASEVPVQKMLAVREKNRRVGLGLMGVHEWLLLRGYRYEPNRELARWVEAYLESTAWGAEFARKLGVNNPIATRSIAPTGTISIVAETTSGIEPIFATAIKRRYLEGTTWKHQYYIDPAAKRLIEQHKVSPEQIEDAYTLAEDVGRRISFQAWLQGYVDQGISSTINMPAWGTANNNEHTVKTFGDTVMAHLPRLRGLTVYPDGARDGQPLTRVTYQEAHGKIGQVFDEELAVAAAGNCKGGVCNS